MKRLAIGTLVTAALSTASVAQNFNLTPCENYNYNHDHSGVATTRIGQVQSQWVYAQGYQVAQITGDYHNTIDMGIFVASYCRYWPYHSLRSAVNAVSSHFMCLGRKYVDIQRPDPNVDCGNPEWANLR